MEANLKQYDVDNFIKIEQFFTNVAIDDILLWPHMEVKASQITSDSIVF